MRFQSLIIIIQMHLDQKRVGLLNCIHVLDPTNRIYPAVLKHILETKLIYLLLTMTRGYPLFYFFPGLVASGLSKTNLIVPEISAFRQTNSSALIY